MTDTHLILPDAEFTQTPLQGEQRPISERTQTSLFIFAALRNESIRRPHLFVLKVTSATTPVEPDPLNATASTFDNLFLDPTDWFPTPYYWMENAKELDERGDDIEAMDLVFDKVDNLLLKGDFSSVDDLLRVIDVSRYSEDLLLTILTATLAAKDNLLERASFFQRVYESLKGRNIDADSVLVGLS